MKNILLAVDFSESTEHLLHAAIEVTKAFSAHLFIIHVAAPDPYFVGYEVETQVRRDAIAKHYRQEHQELGDLAAKARQQGVAATALLVQGPTVEKLIQERVRLHADLVVVGSHGRSAAIQLLVGSTSEGLIRNVHCPVMVIPCNVKSG
jgi:nucleotide-binding universal stress UspA family protein